MTLFWLRRPHVPLLVVLVAMVAAFPWVEDASAAGRCMLSALALVGILLCLHRIRVLRGDLWWMGIVGALALGAEILSANGWRLLEPAYIAAQGVFYAAAAILMSGYMLRDARATVDELFAAAAAFLLMALAWASVYWVIEDVRAGAFLIAHPAQAGRITWFEFVYFSMSTLSTTGYGDMAPASSGARAAVVLEQFIGVMYVALVISRLAGFAGRRADA